MHTANEHTAVHTHRTEGVLVIEIRNPPVNAASAAVRQGLMAALQTLEADPQAQAAVLIGAGSSFVAGSDLREFGQPLQPPQLPAVIAAIEQCSKPIVAALHGAALGGGLELALGCDARIAQAGTMLGLPEVTLGIIPGAGGTQRLPRRTGLLRAIPLVCRGERFTATQALELRLSMPWSKKIPTCAPRQSPTPWACRDANNASATRPCLPRMPKKSPQQGSQPCGQASTSPPS